MQIRCTLKRIQLLPYAERKQQSIMHALHQAYGNVIFWCYSHKVPFCENVWTYLKLYSGRRLLSLNLAFWRVTKRSMLSCLFSFRRFGNKAKRRNDFCCEDCLVFWIIVSWKRPSLQSAVGLVTSCVSLTPPLERSGGRSRWDNMEHQNNRNMFFCKFKKKKDWKDSIQATIHGNIV